MKFVSLKSILLLLGAFFLLVFTISPMVWMIIISFASRYDFLSPAVDFTFQWDNYINVLTSPSLHFLDYLSNSLIIGFIASLVVSIIACLAGYVITRFRFPGRISIPLVVLAVSMFPQISIVGYLHSLFADLGLINTYAALIFPYIAWTVPLAVWINMSYFSQIPVDLDKAALVDGASPLKVLIKIVLPLAIPGIFSSFLLVFIACFNEFLFALMLTTDYSAQTLPVGIALFKGTHGQTPWGEIMAASAIAALPLVALALIFQRFIVQGLMSGAVKG